MSHCIAWLHMADMLVALYALPPLPSLPKGLQIRPALPPEGHLVEAFIARHFSPGWVSEARVGLSATPARVLIALQDGRLAGFACHDVTRRGFFGPTGVAPEFRGRGIGGHLLLRALDALSYAGFAYAIIGDPGPTEFYEKMCGAVPIPNSTPGAYWGLLR